jgi:hypothetical protein
VRVLCHDRPRQCRTLRAAFRGRLLFCPATGWLWWDGRRWAVDGAEGRIKEVLAGALNAHPYAINARNGTLKVGREPDGACIELRQHDPADFITKLVPPGAGIG